MKVSCTKLLRKGIILLFIAQTLPQPVLLCATGQYPSWAHSSASSLPTAASQLCSTTNAWEEQPLLTLCFLARFGWPSGSILITLPSLVPVGLPREARIRPQVSQTWLLACPRCWAKARSEQAWQKILDGKIFHWQTVRQWNPNILWVYLNFHSILDKNCPKLLPPPPLQLWISLFNFLLFFRIANALYLIRQSPLCVDIAALYSFVLTFRNCIQ